MVITGGLEGETGSAETERRVKPQGGYVFRGDVDVFRTSLRTATGTGTKQQEEKTRTVEGNEERKKRRYSVKGKREKTKRSMEELMCLATSICHLDSCGAVCYVDLNEILFNKWDPFKVHLN